MEREFTPKDFPWDLTTPVVPGYRPQVFARFVDGKFVLGNTATERHARWLFCDDIAEQLVKVARKDTLKRPAPSQDDTLERIRVSVGRKGRVSPAELTWLMRRLKLLLEARE